MHRQHHAQSFLRRFQKTEGSVETRFYAKVPGLRAARYFGFLTTRSLGGRWRHDLTDAGRTALADLIAHVPMSTARD
jgi:hypothetical protein